MVVPKWEECKTENDWKTFIQHTIRTNKRALFRSIIIVYGMQTYSEQLYGCSTEHNGVGFSRWDAEEMSVIASKVKNGSPLSQNEIKRAWIIMPKYWKQIVPASKAKLQEKIISECRRMPTYGADAQICSETGVACEYGICNECMDLIQK